MSIIQLLPMNDVGFEFRPYDAQSAFALEPMYLSLESLADIDVKKFKKEIGELKQKFPAGRPKVDYKIKAAKLMLLKKIFEGFKHSESFETFKKLNLYWLHDYALFKVIKEKNGRKSWEDWPAALKSKDTVLLKQLSSDWASEIEFHKWLQWQLSCQMKAAKNYANQKKVLMMGDIPFLVSRDSADVWANQDYFKLDLSSGAPPDGFFAHGQLWGMPPYAWDKIAARSYDYMIQKLKYAENFYDIFRIDHVIGIFRLWTIPRSEPAESGASNGFFYPRDENVWETEGKKHLLEMIRNTTMLPSAEDLGVVPQCAFRVLEEFGIPGMDIQRWKRNWENNYEFTAPDAYRKDSISVISTHDMASFVGWWTFEAGAIDEELFKRKCVSRGISFEEVKSRLFDVEKSAHGKLRWKNGILNKEQLIQILGKPESELKDFVDMYFGTYQEKNKFLNYLGLLDEPAEPSIIQLVRAALEKAAQARSIFSIQLLQDWLSLTPEFECNPWNFRINFPGIVSDSNWSIVIPFSLEKMLTLNTNQVIRKINADADRS